jgi:4-amino-4-deoxy-L-arabinose transferase-like glycosyltransferase
MTTQFIAIFVYLLLIFDENALTHKRSIGIISSVLIILSYCSYWFLIELIPYSDIIWQITLSAGIVTAIYTLAKKLTINYTVSKNESRG